MFKLDEELECREKVDIAPIPSQNIQDFLQTIKYKYLYNKIRNKIM